MRTRETELNKMNVLIKYNHRFIREKINRFNWLLININWSRVQHNIPNNFFEFIHLKSKSQYNPLVQPKSPHLPFNFHFGLQREVVKWTKTKRMFSPISKYHISGAEIAVRQRLFTSNYSVFYDLVVSISNQITNNVLYCTIHPSIEWFVLCSGQMQGDMITCRRPRSQLADHSHQPPTCARLNIARQDRPSKTANTRWSHKSVIYHNSV